MIKLINLSQTLNLSLSRSRTDDGGNSGQSLLHPRVATPSTSLRSPTTSAVAQLSAIPRLVPDAPSQNKRKLDSVLCGKRAEHMFNK